MANTKYVTNEYIYASNGKPMMNEDGEISLPRKKIVRCWYCMYYEPNLYKHFTCELLTYNAEPNDYCAWGERGIDG